MGWNWLNPKPNGNPLLSNYFPDSNTGYAVSYNGKIVKTINAGITWTIHETGINILNSVYFTDVNTGYTVGPWGVILKTNTGSDYFNKFIDSLKIMTLQNVSNADTCSPYFANFFVNTLISGSLYNIGDSLFFNISFGDGSDSIFTKTVTNIPTFIGFNISHTYLNTGVFFVKCDVRAPDNRSDSLIMSIPIIIVDTCNIVSISEVKDFNVDYYIFPNPTNNKVYIQCNKFVDVKIYNVFGQLILIGA